MSNIGKFVIQIPSDINIKKISYGPFFQLIITRGSKQGFGIVLPTDCLLKVEKNNISIDYTTSPEMWGTVNKKIRQMIAAVTTGFTLTLKLTGIGYKARSDSKTSKLYISLGYTKDLEINIPTGIRATCPSPTEINLTSEEGACTLETFTAFAHKIVRIRPATPPLNKGVAVARG